MPDEIHPEALRVPVDTTPALLVDAGDDYVEVTVRGRSGLAATAYVGGPDVTTATGYELPAGNEVRVKLRPGGKLYGTAAVAVTLDVLLVRLN